MNVKNKTVTVVGLGNSGYNAALLLKDNLAVVRVTDSSLGPATSGAALKLMAMGIAVETGSHSASFVKGSDLIVVSPGVEPDSPVMKWAAEFRIPVIGEMELGYRFCRGKIIAITGTNGKSTVTTLIGEILKAAGKDTVVCGNIGNSLCGEISKINKETWVVLEVSSFQLETTEKFKPHISIILNIRDDHMDRYTKFADYFNEKLKIFRNQDGGDFLILNGEAPELKGLAQKARARTVYYSKADGKYASFDSKLKGLHNVENILASCLAARLAGVDESVMRSAVAGFRGLAHRFETVDIIGGVEYVDDSKGTTVDSTARALESCAGPVILIAGGKDKHSDYAAVRDIVAKKARRVVLIGEASGAIEKAFAGAVKMSRASDMNAAVLMARSFASEGDMVLLSPMCSSFDMFSSYKERGDVFRKSVMSLKEKK